jgi:hypothetical protein
VKKFEAMLAIILGISFISAGLNVNPFYVNNLYHTRIRPLAPRWRVRLLALGAGIAFLAVGVGILFSEH